MYSTGDPFPTKEQTISKKIGILGGMSPESTIAYCQYLTRTYAKRFGDYAYCALVVSPE